MNKLKVTITNTLTGYSCGGTFDSQAEVDAYLAKQKAKKVHPMGKAEHDVVVPEKVAPNNRAVFKEDRNLTSNFPEEGYEPVLDDDGETVLYYEKTEYVYTIPCEYEISTEEFIDSSANKNLRDKILAATDWLFVSDTPIPSAHRLYYKNYRQLLRDLDVNVVPSLETFENYLRRTAPEQFLDGGQSEQIIKKFKYYL